MLKLSIVVGEHSVMSMLKVLCQGEGERLRNSNVITQTLVSVRWCKVHYEGPFYFVPVCSALSKILRMQTHEL